MEAGKDLILSGAGVVSGGTYDSIKISGGAKVKGDVICKNFNCSGSVRVDGHLKADEARISGGAKFTQDADIDSFKVSGGMKIEGQLKVKDLDSSGGIRIGRSLEGETLYVTGALSVEQDLSAERFELKGSCKVKGLLNAGQVILKMEDDCEVGSVGAETVSVRLGQGHGFIKGIFSNAFGKGPMLRCHVIEADDIELENVVCNTVRGKHVKIGDNCTVKVVEYSETIEITGSAVVEKETRL